jgi:hypothetical protein
MAAIAWSDVTAMAPELASVAIGSGTDIVNFVNVAFDPDNLGGEDGPKLRYTRLNLAAHLGALILLGSTGGTVTSESIGGLSRSYAAPNLQALALERTSYGQAVTYMIATSPARCGLVV